MRCLLLGAAIAIVAIFIGWPETAIGAIVHPQEFCNVITPKSAYVLINDTSKKPNSKAVIKKILSYWNIEGVSNNERFKFHGSFIRRDNGVATKGVSGCLYGWRRGRCWVKRNKNLFDYCWKFSIILKGKNDFQRNGILRSFWVFNLIPKSIKSSTKNHEAQPGTLKCDQGQSAGFGGLLGCGSNLGGSGGGLAGAFSGFLRVVYTFPHQIQLPQKQHSLSGSNQHQHQRYEGERPRRYGQAPFVRRFFEAVLLLPLGWICVWCAGGSLIRGQAGAALEFVLVAGTL